MIDVGVVQLDVALGVFDIALFLFRHGVSPLGPSWAAIDKKV